MMPQRYDYVFEIIIYDDFLVSGDVVSVVRGNIAARAQLNFSPASLRVTHKNESVVCWVELFEEGDFTLNVGDAILITSDHYNAESDRIRGYGKVLPYNETPSERD